MLTDLTMLTDLEATTIGEILKHSECTAHFIRNIFGASPAKRFSDSSGSVYPMMKRLEKNGMLRSTRRKEGDRFVRRYVVTQQGRDAFFEWLQLPSFDAITISNDPLRTRILYLGKLPKSKRRAWIDKAIAAVKEKIIQLKTVHAQGESAKEMIYQQLAIDSGVAELDSRLAWLAQVKKTLESIKEI